MKKILKDKKAITLIALVITIVVLVILAAVVIRMTVGNDGLIARAIKAANDYKNSQEKEETKINDLYGQLLVASDGTISNLTTEKLQTIINGVVDNKLNESIDTKLNEKMLAIYPIGSIYISTTNTNPSQIIGGEWESVSSGRVLQGADSNHAGGTTINAGLPNITGHLTGSRISYQKTNDPTQESGAITFDGYTNGEYVNRGADAAYHVKNGLTFNASRSNSIYGGSTTVQPPAYVVYIWKRIS